MSALSLPGEANRLCLVAAKFSRQAICINAVQQFLIPDLKISAFYIPSIHGLFVYRGTSITLVALATELQIHYLKWNFVDLLFMLVISLRPRRNRRHYADDIFKCIFLNEDELTSLRISLKFVPNVRINNIPSLVQIMVWRRPGDKPLSEPMVVYYWCIYASLGPNELNKRNDWFGTGLFTSDISHKHLYGVDESP